MRLNTKRLFSINFGPQYPAAHGVVYWAVIMEVLFRQMKGYGLALLAWCKGFVSDSFTIRVSLISFFLYSATNECLSYPYWYTDVSKTKMVIYHIQDNFNVEMTELQEITRYVSIKGYILANIHEVWLDFVQSVVGESYVKKIVTCSTKNLDEKINLPGIREVWADGAGKIEFMDPFEFYWLSESPLTHDFNTLIVVLQPGNLNTIEGWLYLERLLFLLLDEEFVFGEPNPLGLEMIELSFKYLTEGL